MSLFLLSPSSRRAWIEISAGYGTTTSRRVALLAEGVDRNDVISEQATHHAEVALLAEGVDRNDLRRDDWELGKRVALLAEGVDRN